MTDLRLTPVVARTECLHRRREPIAYDCVKLIFVRAGSAWLFSEFGERPVKVGDAVLLAANTLCGAEPEDWVTVTTLYLDRDYVVDQVFWQYAAVLADRLAAKDFIAARYSEPAQVLRLGEDRAGCLMPWLDELSQLSLDGPAPERFYRMQALLFAVLDVISPFVTTTAARQSPTQHKATCLAAPALRRLAPLRTEARDTAHLLRDEPARRWTLGELAAAVHLSPSQLGRVFVDAYGKTPMTYLATLRAEHLARLLRETDLPIEQAMREVGWHSRGHAARLFRQAVGITPTRYRHLSRQNAVA
ncbi:AraC family transcriptional regulator [Micrococcus luteus]|uniref:DNA-binding domain-containing protein, AraC-type n=2 Tax=Micrococcus luteus TaxID=1270 RepID=C5C802_MICLC|nr:DNA-binding domain-containing protein, AraC-type [Micrococcus luteus NCTC 2665]AJO54752.1 AraC family transcriptional regulator [Micrococcus luteus]ORE56957.1 AraC family transcriptional regulator [Micrococcus luteus]SQG48278.1 DNA-binding transcriptional regulator AraC [Micrococcus luteus NCTC 2665]